LVLKFLKNKKKLSFWFKKGTDKKIFKKIFLFFLGKNFCWQKIFE